MSLLLDTHIWIWAYSDSRRLAPAVRTQLDRHLRDLWLSPVSIWEVVQLQEKGRLNTRVPLEEWLHGLRMNIPLKEAPLTSQVAWETRRFRLEQRDPADRFLVATARVYELTLVTADERLISAKACKVLANR